ncbi:hypothetical protein HMP09_3342 [Sphingomonas sp. HMP9]|uniref:hypothetical protein n=1 Tax=Sphingomonas sp. HMP9 TaxID=1517554 RepID=UPI0015969C86|nr:hypothetical protein [Sphingomonas sp. HMP9]BCA64108.1 hypothetical protein HMP09_3342 [Sphingomonas sp. HMP9]
MTAPLAPLAASDAPPHATPAPPQTAAHPENAPQEAAPPHDYAPATPARYTQRSDGWTPDRQRGFLERIAEGATVDEASTSVGLSPGAAYSLRRRAVGAAFALGWDAAKLVARPIVAETLFLRAIAGQTERVTRPDGAVIERHRYDNRLAMSLLNRLDRHADTAETANAATRMVAAEFDAFLDIIARDAGPARAGLFLGERLETDATGLGAGPGTGAGPGGAEAAMAPILALARADRWLRSAAGVASGIDIADLDPAARADWTAEQWSRAEAAGLLRLAPAPAPEYAPRSAPEPASAPGFDPDTETAPASALSILHSDLQDGRDPDCPVWYDHIAEGWRTRFPPPPEYFGTEDGVFGDDDYSRECSDDEAIILEAPREREIAERVVSEGADRDLWFVGYAIDCGLIDEASVAAAGMTDADRVARLAGTFDPLQVPPPIAEPEPGPGQPTLQADGSSPRPPDAAPNSPIGRSPAVTLLDDRNFHEHLQQDQVRHLR